MKKIQKHKIAALALALVCSATILTGQRTPVQAAPTDATVQSYEQQLAELAAKQKDALAKLENVRGSMSDVRETKQTYDQVVELSIKKKNLTMQQLDKITEQIKTKQSDIAAAEEGIRVQEEAFMDRMVTLYMEGEASYLELILGAQSMVDFLTRVDTVTSILEYDQYVIEQLEENTVKLENSLIELETALTLQQAHIKTLEDDILETKRLSEEAAAYMTSLEQNESALLQNYYKTKELETELNAKLEARLKELLEKEKSSYVGGAMGWPLPVDVNYQVSSEFGWRTLWGAKDYHLGIDLACAANTAIYAANSGKVIESQYHYSYGNYVLIDHGGGKATLYAHMNERWVSAGDKVNKGQQIGLVGTTGSSSGNHLHFEVRENGVVQEPRNYINLP